MILRCPSCGKTGQVLSSGDEGAANNNEHHVAFTPPEGFVKVQFGWSSAEVRLYCRVCGSPAEVVE